MTSEAKIYILGNGLRVAFRHTDSHVSYIGLAINAGSRDESHRHDGLAHFVEHTLFKGTEKRKSWHISNRMESVGGELNAYTSKEETMLYTGAPAGYEERAIELLADIVKHSTFPETELLKEREVVIEEIHSYLDSPADAVFDEYEELIYRDSRLAHNILGTEESVMHLTGHDCRGFLDRYYTASNMVMYIAAPISADKALKIAERHFGNLPAGDGGPLRVAPPAAPLFNEVHTRDGHQSHSVMGTRTFGRRDPRRFALFLLNNYLGGPCMNSRLNQEIREKRGLAYTVESNVGLLSDCGTLNIYFGTTKEQSGKCADIVRRELQRLADQTLSPRKFAAIRDQYCGQLLLSSDHRESVAMSMAKSTLYYGEIHDVAETAEHVRQVTAEQLRDVAETLAASPLNMLTLQ